MGDKAKPTVVLSYGCPRSGTSVTAKMCSSLVGEGVISQKWKELSPLHPGHVDNGMLQLSIVFPDCRLIFVRSVRHPLDVVKSFYALRTEEVKSKGTIKFTSDEKILEWLEKESENTALQWRRLRKEHPWKGYDVHLIEAKYEVLNSEDRFVFTQNLSRLLPNPEASRAALDKYLTLYWGSQQGSVRAGQLSAGYTVMLREEKETWWREQLVEVAEREGYSL